MTQKSATPRPAAKNAETRSAPPAVEFPLDLDGELTEDAESDFRYAQPTRWRWE